MHQSKCPTAGPRSISLSILVIIHLLTFVNQKNTVSIYCSFSESIHIFLLVFIVYPYENNILLLLTTFCSLFSNIFRSSHILNINSWLFLSTATVLSLYVI